MTIYEIDDQIRQIIEQGFTVDEETGELLTDLSRLDELQILREQKIENTACYLKNIAAEANELKVEENNLKERRRVLDNKIARLKDYLKYALGGENFTAPRAQIRFRHSTIVSIDSDFIEWAEKHDPDLLRYKDPEPDKTAIGKLLKAGDSVPHASLVDNLSMTIK